MKITKYPQSCLLVESNGIRLLFDPGVLKYEPAFQDEWQSADAIFITHKHSDHCNAEVIAKLAGIPVYTTAEVINAYPDLKRVQRVKQGDEVAVGEVHVKAVKAVHGYHPRMKGNEISENIGFVVCDKSRTLYITSDTICFAADIKADILAVPVTGYGVTMTAFEASLFAKECAAKHILLTHMDNDAFEVDTPYIEKHFKNAGLAYTVPEIGRTLEYV